MQIPILVEPVAEKVYRARSGEPLGLTAEGATADEAVQKLREQINARLAAGSKIVPVEVPDTSNPWLRIAGMFKDDPLFEEWQEAVAENRKTMDADLEIL